MLNCNDNRYSTRLGSLDSLAPRHEYCVGVLCPLEELCKWFYVLLRVRIRSLLVRSVPRQRYSVNRHEDECSMQYGCWTKHALMLLNNIEPNALTG